MRWWFLSLLTIAGLVGACGGGQQDISTIATTAPASETGSASSPGASTPVTRGSPADQALTAEAIVQALVDRGLPIDSTVTYTAETDPNELLGRPAQYVGKASFHDSRLDAPSDPKVLSVTDGGSVEVFRSDDDARRRFDYVSEIAKLPLVAEYDVLVGTVLLRLSGGLTPDQAAVYKAALRAVLGVEE